MKNTIPILSTSKIQFQNESATEVLRFGVLPGNVLTVETEMRHDLGAIMVRAQLALTEQDTERFAGWLRRNGLLPPLTPDSHSTAEAQAKLLEEELNQLKDKVTEVVRLLSTPPVCFGERMALNEIKSTAEAHVSQLESLRKELADLKAIHSEKLTELQDANDEAKHWKEKAMRLRSDLDEVRSSKSSIISNLANEIKTRAENYDILTQDYTGAKADADSYAKQIEDYRHRLSMIQHLVVDSLHPRHGTGGCGIYAAQLQPLLSGVLPVKNGNVVRDGIVAYLTREADGGKGRRDESQRHPPSAAEASRVVDPQQER